MAQTWVDNNESAGGTTGKQGFINLEDKCATLQSNWSGTAYPSSGVTVIGQTCWRTDLGKLYLLTAKGPETWKQIPVEGNTLGADWLATDAVTTAKIADANVTAAKLADAAVTTVKLTDANVTTAKLADSAVTTAKIADANVTAAKLASNAVTSAKVATGAITETKLGNSAVTTAKVADGAVTEAKLADDSVSAAKLKSATANIIFGTNPGSTDVVEISRASVFRTFAGRPVASLFEGCHQPNGAAIITSDGSVFCIGYTSHAAPDYSSGRTYHYGWRPVLFEDDPGAITKVVLTRTSGFALTSTGKVWSWGNNSFGQLGHGDTTQRKLAKKIAALDSLVITDVIAAAAGYGASYDSVWFLTDDGKVYGCGSNANGQLGDASTTQRSTPVQAGTLTGITQLSIGDSGTTPHVIALKSDGAVYTWGYNAQGQLGQGDTTQRTSPTLVAALTNIDLVKANSSIALGSTFAADGSTIKACGYNGYGALGDASTTQRTSFVTATALPGSPGNIVQIAGSSQYGFTVARDANGLIYATGRNGSGQIGQGNTTDRNTFAAITVASGVVAEDMQVTAIDSDTGTVFVLGDDGELYATGYNGNGQIGQADTTNRTSFTKLKRSLAVDDPITAFRAVGSSTSLGSNQCGVLAITQSGMLLGCGQIAGCGLGFAAMPGDTTAREERVLTPIPIVA